MAVGNGVRDWAMPALANDALYWYKIGALAQPQWEALVGACHADETRPACQRALAAAGTALDGYNIYNVDGDCISHRPLPRAPASARVQATPPGTVGSIPPCLDAYAARDYLNRADVQQALHVKRLKWDICSDAVGDKYQRTRQSVAAEYLYLLRNGFRVLVYNGDNDAACPYTGNEYQPHPYPGTYRCMPPGISGTACPLHDCLRRADF